jgi:4-hydroxybenzoate polyprenyltransferase
VVVLATLYTLRVYAGGLVSGAYVSPWLFQFSIFLFLSLAFVKRYSELRRTRHQHQVEVRGRNYQIRDLSIISQAGLGSGLIAGLVMALYVNGQDTEKAYPHPEMLWGICPLFIYWIIRVWLIAHRGNMNEDPILFAFRDRVSYILAFLIVVLVLLGLSPNV